MRNTFLHPAKCSRCRAIGHNKRTCRRRPGENAKAGALASIVLAVKACSEAAIPLDDVIDAVAVCIGMRLEAQPLMKASDDSGSCMHKGRMKLSETGVPGNTLWKCRDCKKEWWA